MIDVAEVRFSNFARLGFMLSAVSSLLMMAAALGYRWDLWSVRFALLTLTKYATYGALGGAALSMVGIGRSWPGGASRGLALSVVGVIIGMGAFYIIFIIMLKFFHLHLILLSIYLMNFLYLLQYLINH